MHFSEYCSIHSSGLQTARSSYAFVRNKFVEDRRGRLRCQARDEHGHGGEAGILEQLPAGKFEIVHNFVAADVSRRANPIQQIVTVSSQNQPPLSAAAS